MRKSCETAVRCAEGARDGIEVGFDHGCALSLRLTDEVRQECLWTLMSKQTVD